ncbi:DUF7133 domain-containing protein [Stratiformator vulcanicus]|uniref:Cytochrome c n=1 Tax=Stratiformator vulcanicus TaxID=2527980 RepID=A0A517QWN2_9PLAN|nr:HEAT repeat domain-containing protein [Stratiformator vulcanicus]QDT36072.1 Cytochrome c [Stratiformator vulcanicus]
MLRLKLLALAVFVVTGQYVAGETKNIRVKSPDGFRATPFALPPDVNYPVCLSAAVTGELFVGVDPQGSLGKEKGDGKVVRCIDTDGDGTADEFTEFCRVDHPRGLFFDDGQLWVLHPPKLSVFTDNDGDGVADSEKVLVENISTEMIRKRGADHSTNGIRMGIDGWIYIAMGDYGVVNATGTDGRTVTHRGGGVLRVRPDGTELELFCTGLRNIVDVCVDPYLNIFTRDNTNDGGGWDTRVSHIIETAEYGYPSLFKNFSDEIMPPLGEYGGGSGCGGLSLDDRRWPSPFATSTYTCDWGRNTVYRHELTSRGPTFTTTQQTFLKMPRPTDIDIDGAGRMYVSSWRNGKFRYTGPDVGFVAQITPPGFKPQAAVAPGELDLTAVVDQLRSPSAVVRLHAQRELLRRSNHEDTAGAIRAVMIDADANLASRVAALFALKQLQGEESHFELVNVLTDPALRRFALKALTDRRNETQGIKVDQIRDFLNDANAKVRAQAVISLSRLDDRESVDELLSLYKREVAAQQGESRPVAIPHLIIQALVGMKADEQCVAALSGPNASIAVRALQQMHSSVAVDGLINQLNAEPEQAMRCALITALIRLYHREASFQGRWWGTRPDTAGPYFKAVEWEQSPRIAKELRSQDEAADAALKTFLREELIRHRVSIDGIDILPSESEREVVVEVKIPKFDPLNPQQIGNRPQQSVISDVMDRRGKAERGAELFRTQSCHACHSTAKKQQAIGPHLADIGKRSKPREILESILDPDKKITQGFDTYSFILADGKVVTGFVTQESGDAVSIRKSDGSATTVGNEYIEERIRQELSSMPKGLVNNLTAEELSDLIAFLQSL